MKSYRGKVCAKHPDLAGLRRASNRKCVGCKRDRDRTPRGRELLRERQRRYRAAFKERQDGKTYSGSPCATCGTSERYTSNRACVHCYGVARERMRKLRPETTFIGAVCPKHPEAGGVRRSRRGGVCVECNRERMRGDSFTAATERWRENNPERFRVVRHARTMLRRARKKSATEASAELRQVMIELSREAKRFGLTIDHSVPLAGCRVCGAQGRHEVDNLHLMSPSDNSSKGNRCMTCWALEANRRHDSLTHE
jgi:hypothetical protein